MDQIAEMAFFIFLTKKIDEESLTMDEYYHLSQVNKFFFNQFTDFMTKKKLTPLRSDKMRLFAMRNLANNNLTNFQRMYIKYPCYTVANGMRIVNKHCMSYFMFDGISDMFNKIADNMDTPRFWDFRETLRELKRIVIIPLKTHLMFSTASFSAKILYATQCIHSSTLRLVDDMSDTLCEYCKMITTCSYVKKYGKICGAKSVKEVVLLDGVKYMTCGSHSECNSLDFIGCGIHTYNTVYNNNYYTRHIQLRCYQMESVLN